MSVHRFAQRRVGELTKSTSIRTAAIIVELRVSTFRSAERARRRGPATFGASSSACYALSQRISLTRRRSCRKKGWPPHEEKCERGMALRAEAKEQGVAASRK